MSSGNVDKYEFLTGEDFLLENNVLGKRCCNQKIWIFAITQRVEIGTRHCKRSFKLLKDQHVMLLTTIEKMVSKQAMNTKIWLIEFIHMD